MLIYGEEADDKATADRSAADFIIHFADILIYPFIGGLLGREPPSAHSPPFLALAAKQVYLFRV